ncbi:hypothetical protein HanRHA438_Chr15g0703521 [Helianthus annuus]|nr:hypothetical protein HanIR_Chr15g0751001 [Helianthus annuus]KAJ0844532.1 hypothetical protein HanRHA438_Chr15g0703521 [Helianthus annuus]
MGRQSRVSPELHERLYDPHLVSLRTSDAPIEVPSHRLRSRRQVSIDVLWVLRRVRRWRGLVVSDVISRRRMRRRQRRRLSLILSPILRLS